MPPSFPILSDPVRYIEVLQHMSNLNPPASLETERALFYAEIIATDDNEMFSLTEVTSVTLLFSLDPVDNVSYYENDNGPSSKDIERYLKTIDASMDLVLMAPVSIARKIGMPEDGYWE